MPDDASASPMRVTPAGWAIIGLHLAGIAAVAYVLACDAVAGNWVAFLALPLWGLVLAGAGAAAVLGGEHLGRWTRAALVVLALAALPIASQLAPRLEPLARVHREARVARSHDRHEALVRRHCRELADRLNGRRRVVDVAGWFPILEGGYGAELVGVPASEELGERLERTLVGEVVTVQVAPDCPERYLPDAASGLLFDRGLASDGRGHLYGAAPIHLWRGEQWLNRRFAPPNRRDDLRPPPRE